MTDEESNTACVILRVELTYFMSNDIERGQGRPCSTVAIPKVYGSGGRTIESVTIVFLIMDMSFHRDRERTIFF
jgi:hypothetical protein